jgi:hypothetical protein
MVALRDPFLFRPALILPGEADGGFGGPGEGPGNGPPPGPGLTDPYIISAGIPQRTIELALRILNPHADPGPADCGANLVVTDG